MSANTNIQWCDHTYNPWRGCRKVAPECANCYITNTTPFRTRKQVHGSERVRAGEATLREPLRWERDAVWWRECPKCGWHGRVTGPMNGICPTENCLTFESEMNTARPRVFCLSLGDWLDDENVPIEWLADLLATIHATPHLDWLLLTKRPGNWSKRSHDALAHIEGITGDWPERDPNTELGTWLNDWSADIPPANVWIGVSAGADQAAALAIPARFHFLSCEPMLHAMDTTHASRFDWIIFGGESGPGARACNVDWIRDGVKFCREHKVAPFVKQLGANVPCPQAVAERGQLWPYGTHLQSDDGTWRLHIRDRKGGDPAEWPEDLRVREFPDGKVSHGGAEDAEKGGGG